METIIPSSLKSVFLVIFLVMASSGEIWLWRAEARGEFRCPRMIDCDSVCQGFPNCCVDGQCICQPCSTLSPPQPQPQPHRSKSKPDVNV